MLHAVLPFLKQTGMETLTNYETGTTITCATLKEKDLGVIMNANNVT